MKLLPFFIVNFLSFQFTPMNFVDNLKYMLFGMLGIMAIMAVIIGSIYLIGALTSKPKNKKIK